MFASRYFPDRYYAPRYFAKAGATPLGGGSANMLIMRVAGLLIPLIWLKDVK